MVVNRGPGRRIPLSVLEHAFPSPDSSIPLLRLGLRGNRGEVWLSECSRPAMGKLLMSLFLLAAPLALAAGDVSGKWTGSMDMTTPDGQAQSMPVTAEFKQDGASVTGTAGREGDEQLPIEKGTVDGEKITFEVHAPDGAYTVSLTVVSDSQLKGDVTFADQDGNKATAKLTFTRAK